MKLHLQKHGITNGITVSPPGQRTIIAAWKQSDELSHQARLERNLLRWTVTELQPFTAIERPAFRSIFADLPGVTLPLGSRHTLRRRIESEFAEYRLKLKEELAATCNTIALSLDAWTSKNSIAILAVIGHWLNQDFEYQERLLEFKEIEGAHSGENMAEMIENLLIELNLEHKLLTITADNASNNETLVSELYFNLSTKVSRTDGIVSGNRAIRFQGLDSYVRCLANVLNLIVKEILSALKSGDSKRANEACDQLRDGKGIGAHTAMARLRILALWIARIPQRKQSWKNVCRINNLPDKFIVYDVENRWNSTDQMLDDSLASKRQIEEYILLQNQIPPFSSEDWQHLQQVHKVLTKFNEFTLLVSSGTSQISLTLSIYYEFSDLLVDAAECKEEFSGLEPDIAAAVAAGLAKYQKYYTFMDDSDTYYAAVILDPRTKGGLLRKELGDDGESIVNAIKERLHNEYPSQVEPEPLYSSSQMQATLEDRMLQRVQPRREHRSDIDHYFNSEPIAVTGLATKEKGWLCSWWKAHQGEFPRMALAARDYLAIPASEVAVERVFNKGRDMLGLRRHSMSAETMRILMLMRD